MNKIEQILVLLLFLPVLHVMAEDNNGLMLDKFNANGSLVADKSRGIAYITYDLNNNPKQIYFTNGSVTKYVYSAAGQKLRVVYYTAKPNISRTWGVKPAELTASQILQVDSTDYLLGGSLTMKNGKIDRYLFDGGYAQATATGSNNDSFAFYYYNQDHLGNIREVVDASGNILQVTNYYPFGTPYFDASSTKNADMQPYKYNGKELDRMHGLDTYDYGARQYDPILCRWDRIDPLCEKYYSISPYVYCANNPVRYVDPDGSKVVIWYGPKGYEKSFTFSGFHGKSSLQVPNNPFVKAVIQAYVYDCKNGGGEAFKRAVHRKETIYVADARVYNEGINSFEVDGHQPTVNWNPDNGIKTTEGGVQSPATIIEHEMDHGNDNLDNPKNHNDRRRTPDSQYGNKEERRVITGAETKTARSNGEAIRKDHKGMSFRTVSPVSTQPYN